MAYLHLHWDATGRKGNQPKSAKIPRRNGSTKEDDAFLTHCYDTCWNDKEGNLGTVEDDLSTVDGMSDNEDIGLDIGNDCDDADWYDSCAWLGHEIGQHNSECDVEDAYETFLTNMRNEVSLKTASPKLSEHFQNFRSKGMGFDH